MIGTGGQFADNNANQYPQIYTRIIDPASLEPFHTQINRYFSNLRERGMKKVEISSYLIKCPFNTSLAYRILTDEIMKMFNACAKLQRNQNDYDVVFVWDIEDITMLGSKHFDELTMMGVDLTSLESLKERVCHSATFDSLKEIELINFVSKVDNIQDAIEHIETDEIRKAAPMYDALRQLYNKVNNVKSKRQTVCHDLLDKLGILEQEDEICRAARKHQQIFNRRWKYTEKCSKLVNRQCAKLQTKKYANVVLCNEGIADGIAQLVISGNNKEIPIENIYSTFIEPENSNDYRKKHVRMKSVFKRIQDRFGENCLFIHVTSNPRCCDFPIPIASWPIRANESIELLYNFQRDFLSATENEIGSM